jgi:hypothetical protein
MHALRLLKLHIDTIDQRFFDPIRGEEWGNSAEGKRSGQNDLAGSPATANEEESGRAVLSWGNRDSLSSTRGNVMSYPLAIVFVIKSIGIPQNRFA